MKINIKARLKNKVFLMGATALIISFVYKLLAMFDIIAPISENDVTEIVSIVINILAFLGVIVDPTTKGISDSDKTLESSN